MRARTVLSAALALAISLPAFGAANITVVNADGAGEGFNDPTPVAPVGGNTGTTIGQQRLNVFQAAAQIWGSVLTSVPAILVLAQFDAQTCTANNAVLGAAGPRTFFYDPAGAVLTPANTLFHAALTNKLVGSDVFPPSSGSAADGGEEIAAIFNSSLGAGGVGVSLGCGFTFYMGLDNSPPPGQIDLLTVVLHELGHGLGFSTSTNGANGARLANLNHKYDTFLLDSSLGLTWSAMTNAQRAQSAIRPRRLVWTGANVTASAPAVLSQGSPELVVAAPSTLAGTYLASALQSGSSAFPNLTAAGLSGEVMPALDTVAPFTDACSALAPASALGLNGKIALVDRGTCTFNDKLARVTAAGAIGMIIVDNTPASPPPVTGASTVPAIPSLLITQADGALLRDFLRFRSRTNSGLLATLRLNNAALAGTDTSGRLLMFAPNPFQPGSSVSHWDPIAFRNLLMEPAFSPGLTHSVTAPQDLTFALLRDLGW